MKIIDHFCSYELESFHLLLSLGSVLKIIWKAMKFGCPGFASSLVSLISKTNNMLDDERAASSLSVCSCEKGF